MKIGGPKSYKRCITCMIAMGIDGATCKNN